MNETRKRPESDDEELGVAEKRQRSTPMISDEDYDVEDFLAEFPIQEETVMEVMKVLEEEITCPNNNIKYFASSSSMSFFSSSSSSFVTINGNEQSCGVSFSNSESTVMASMYLGDNTNNLAYFLGNSEALQDWSLRFSFLLDQMFFRLSDHQTNNTEENGDLLSGDNEKINGCDNIEESDDEWIERVLSEIAFGFENNEE